MKQKFIILIILVVGCTTVSFVQDMRAGTWYDTCSILMVASRDEVKKLDIETKKKIRQCQFIAAKVWCENDYEGGPEGSTLTDEQLIDISDKLSSHCPSYLELPLGGLHYIPLKYWEAKGGIPLWKRWFSAESIVLEAYKNKWPTCSATRRKYGLIHKGEDRQKCIQAWMKVATD